MTQIRSLFDPEKGIHRSIEKVISYHASQEERLKAEIREYIVTESIERQLERLLENIQAAMESGGGHEVGVWVSGFYGSGKSSFTKYLGLAFDQSVRVDGQPFLRHLQDRLHKATTKALLATVAARFPAAVVMLDLASEQIAGATLAELSTVLYFKVLQYAGYSPNLKVAALERVIRELSDPIRDSRSLPLFGICPPGKERLGAPGCAGHAHAYVHLWITAGPPRAKGHCNLIN